MGPIRHIKLWGHHDTEIKRELIDNFIAKWDRKKITMLALCSGDGRELRVWRDHIVKVKLHDLSFKALSKAMVRGRRFKIWDTKDAIICSDISKTGTFAQSLDSTKYDVI